MFETDNQEKDKQAKDQSDLVASGGINLLPEDLRSLESKVLKHGGDRSSELRLPKERKVEPEEGKAPWFSLKRFRPVLKRTQAPAEAKVAKPPAPAKPKKFVFRFLKNRAEAKRRQEAESEEALRQEVLDHVQKKQTSLPPHEHELFNQEQRQRAAAAGRPEPAPIVPESPVKYLTTEAAASQPASLEKHEDLNLPKAGLEEQLESQLPAGVTPQGPAEPLTPALPARPLSRVPGYSRGQGSDNGRPEAKADNGQLAAKTKQDKSDKKAGLKASKFHIPHFNHFGRGRPLASMEVNLIPTSLTLKTWKQLSRSLLGVMVASLVFLGLVYGLFLAWEQQLENQTKEVDDKIRQVQARITGFKELQQEIAAMEEQITAVQSLLNQHIHWTRFLTLLEKYTLDDVYFEGLTAGINGNLSLAAHGQDFTTAARQLLLLQSAEAKELVVSVDITGVSDSGQGGVSFTIDLVLNSNLFYLNGSN